MEHREADWMNIDTHGLWWVYQKEEEVMLISKKGIEWLKFENLPDNMKKTIEKHMNEEKH